MTNYPPPDDSLDQSSSEKGDDIPNVVYHYTNTASLLSIIEHQKLWATSLRYMNDRQEYSFGSDAIVGALEEHLKVLQQRTDVVRANGYGSDPDTPPLSDDEVKILMLIDKLRHDSEELSLFNSWGFSPSASIFSASFCESGDLLSQWRGYGGNGGWAIGFDLKKIVESDETIEAVKVQYGLDCLRNDIPSIINKISDRIANPYPNDEPVLEDWAAFYQTDWSGQDVIEIPVTEKVSYDITGSYVKGLAGYKHPAFSEEQEWRIMVDEQTARNRWFAHQNTRGPIPAPSWCDAREDLDSSSWAPVKFRPGQVALTPYLEIPFPKDAIREVVIGPHPHLDLQKASLQWFLLQHGLLEQVEIKFSEAPFR